MKKSIAITAGATLISYLIQHYLMEGGEVYVDVYNAFAFGLGWGMAYFVDQPQWALPKKMGISFIGIALLVILGFLFFDFETAVPSIIKFSTVFVAYYLMASFRESKSLRR